MKENFGKLPSGKEASLYTIACGRLKAAVSDFGATLVKLYVPDHQGHVEDVVLGFDEAASYLGSTAYFGATVGRNANRVGRGRFTLNGREYQLPCNDGQNNLHSGPDGYSYRLWQVTEHRADAITLALESPNGDQGFPGKAAIQVTYQLEAPATLRIEYRAVSDQDTVFNLTNHTYFNLAGHSKTGKAMEQILMLPARHFCPADEQSIPTGEKRPVDGTPMDFRIPKPIGRDIGEDYDALKLQKGYDHNFEVFCNPCAILQDPDSGRSVAISTDCCGIQFYSGNYTDEVGKGGVHYGLRSGVALETQFYPDAVNHPDWKQPVTKAGEIYRSVTTYKFD